jgi:hypothetical protein
VCSANAESVRHRALAPFTGGYGQLQRRLSWDASDHSSNTQPPLGHLIGWERPEDVTFETRTRALAYAACRSLIGSSAVTSCPNIRQIDRAGTDHLGPPCPFFSTFPANRRRVFSETINGTSLQRSAGVVRCPNRAKRAPPKLQSADSAAPIHDRGDRVAGVVIVFHDVSEAVTTIDRGRYL